MSGTVGFVGLGNMGLPMATNLLGAGYALKVYNRTASRIQPLEAKGAYPASTAAETATPRGIVVTMLADDRALETLFACTIYQNYGRMVLARRFEPAGFRLELGLKDVDLLLKTAGSSKVAMPAASLLHDRMVAGVAKGRGHLDWTAVVLDILEDAGLKPGS